MESQFTKLILWDIDLTLIRAGQVGRDLYAKAFQLLTGRPMTVQVEAAGRMDPDIFVDALSANGLDSSAYHFTDFASRFASIYASENQLLCQHGQALPGARAALSTLANHTGVLQSVLTGNIEPVAKIKLATFGLDRYLDLEIGAYGSDAPSRAELIEVAQQRADAKYKINLPLSAITVIGDSAHDVMGAHKAGVTVIAVASGRTPLNELRALQPTSLFPDLIDTQAVVNAVWGGDQK